MYDYDHDDRSYIMNSKGRGDMASGLNDEAFIRSQLGEIQRYIENFPGEHEDQIVMRWISRHAASYRKKWNEYCFRG